MKPRRPAFVLTHELVAQHSGGGVICLDMKAVGKRHKLYDRRPGAEFNRALAWQTSPRNSVIDNESPDAFEASLSEMEPPPSLILVKIEGVLEQRAGWHDCGWSDGHDAIAERMIEGMQTSDLFIEFDTPGGAAAGLEEAVNRVMKAKAELGRRITGYCNEMIASAGYWWAACVCDEIYSPAAGITGSIGARGAHESCAEALKMNGYKVTYFAYPGLGKVALAPELELSELGKQRGNRDVTISGERFVEAICNARGLDRKAVLELDADMLHAKAALDFGLIDGIAPIEDVISYATALADLGNKQEADDMDARHITRTRNENPDPNTPENQRTENDPNTPPEKPGEQRSEPDPDNPDADERKCEGCGEPGEDDDKYCANCGRQFEADPDDDPKPSSEADPNEPKPEPKPDDARAQTRANARTSGPELADQSLAELVGLSKGASNVAIKTAVIGHVKLSRYAMQLTDTQTAAGAIGGLKALAEEASQVSQYKQSIEAATRREQYSERLSLLTKLAAANLPGYPRGDLLIDREVNGKRVVAPTAMYNEMKLDTLRGFVNGKLKNAAPRQRNPFEASHQNAKDAQLDAFVDEVGGSDAVKDITIQTSASTEDLKKSRAALARAGFIH